MPRTKVNKSKANKRSRGTHDEKLQEFDLLVDSYLMEVECSAEKAKTNIEMELHRVRSKLPGKVLQMKMSDVRKIEAMNFVNSPSVGKSPAINSVFASFNSFQSASPTPTTARLPPKSTSDEGYSTHEETNGSARQTPHQLPIPKITGPFMSAQIKKRRSRSAQSSTGGVFTPQINPVAFGQTNRILVKRTQSGLLSSRPSRPKYRTPVMHGRLKAASADRLMITPKVQPNTPMALLRHARTGESVFSVTGSPVITSVSGEQMANVNIPIGDSILSIRPTEMGNIDPAYISRIDKNTINHLKVLQQNINRIMESAGRYDKSV